MPAERQASKSSPPRRTFYPHCTAAPHPASIERGSRPDAASPCKKSTVPMRQKHDVRATKERHLCNKIEILWLDFASWPCSSKSQLGFYLLPHKCHFTKMDSNGSFQPQNLKFVAREVRLASDDASDTRISRPSQHAKAHDPAGTTRTGTAQSGAQRAWAKEHPLPQRSALRQKVTRIPQGTTRPLHAPSPQTKSSPRSVWPRGGSKARFN